MAAGAAAMLLTSHAMAADPLAASQPGFTIADPVAASLLGVFIFREHVQASPPALTAEALGIIVTAIGAWALSGSELITDRANAATSPETRHPGSPRGRDRPEKSPMARRADLPARAGVAQCSRRLSPAQRGLRRGGGAGT